MEAVFLSDQTISAYNRSRSQATPVNGFVYRGFSGNLAHGSLLNIHGHGSLFGVPPSLSSSFSSLSPSARSPSSASSFSSFSSFGSNSQQQPPLLPLPSIKFQSLPSPTPNRKINRSSVKDQTQEPKKAKSVSFDLKKESSKSTMAKDRLMTASSSPAERLGPDPCDLPTKVPKVMNSSPTKASSSSPDEFEEFSGSIFSLSPHPSSLPLPKFSVRPKSKCNAEAARVVDAGATDDLRRLLRLQ